jgi:hypothetical protein
MNQQANVQDKDEALREAVERAERAELEVWDPSDRRHCRKGVHRWSWNLFMAGSCPCCASIPCRSLCNLSSRFRRSAAAPPRASGHRGFHS